MEPLAFQCPHCGGTLYVQPANLGHQVSCPTCHGLVALPAADHPAMPPSASPDETSRRAAADAEEEWQLSCPHCRGLFQVTSSMAGQQVACPHCTRPALIEAPRSTGAGEPQRGATLPVPDQRNVFEAPPMEEAPETLGGTAELDPAFLYPPGFGPPGKSGAAGQPGAAGHVSEQRPLELSPASPAGESTPAADVPRDPVPSASASPLLLSSAESPATSSATSTSSSASPKVDDLLPPPAEPTRGTAPGTTSGTDDMPAAASAVSGAKADVASWLPPPATGPPQGASKVDELLPPSAAGEGTPRPAQAESADSVPWPVVPDPPKTGPTLIPTEDGSHITLREPLTTVGQGADEREIRRLTPEEKARRRLIRNLILWTIGTLVLIAAVLILRWLGPL